MAARPAVGVPVKIAVTARVEGDVGRLSIEANATQIGFYVGARMMIERIAAGLGPLE